MGNIIKEQRELREQDREVVAEIRVPLSKVRSKVKTEDGGLFSDDNRWEIDFEPELLQKFGIDVEDTVTVQMFKIAGVPIVNISILE